MSTDLEPELLLERAMKELEVRSTAESPRKLLQRLQQRRGARPGESENLDPISIADSLVASPATMESCDRESDERAFDGRGSEKKLPGSPLIDTKQRFFASSRKLDQREVELRRRERMASESSAAMDSMRQDLDKWESRLATWKETLVRKAKELDQRKESVNEFSQQRESRAADLLRKLTSERNALAVDKEALRKARHVAEGEFQEQTTLLRYRRKELAAIKSRCKDQIEECERREAQLVQHELAVKTFSEEVLSQQKELEERARTVEEAEAESEKLQKQLEQRRIETEQLDIDARQLMADADQRAEAAQAIEDSILSNRRELEETSQQLDDLAAELSRRDEDIQERESEVKRKEEDLLQSLEEASNELVESEKENMRRSEELDVRDRAHIEHKAKLLQWEEEIRLSSNQLASKQKDLELREKHLSRYLSSFEERPFT